MTWTAVVQRTRDPARILAEVASVANGATILFLGTVREVNEGRAVTGIDYAAYSSMAESELAAIANEVSEQFATHDVVVEHRIGTLALGEASIAIAVGHPHRAAAFDAARAIIEQVKKRVPIWKREHYEDGTRQWVDPTRPAVSAR